MYRTYRDKLKMAQDALADNFDFILAGYVEEAANAIETQAAGRT